MKKILSGVMAITMILLLSIPVYATDNKESHTYVKPDGTEIIYYLNDEGYPYVIKGNEEVPVALPLKHLEVKDSAILEKLNKERLLMNTRGAPTTYFNLYASSPSNNSIKYTQGISFASSTIHTTQFLKMYAQHEGLSIRTANVNKTGVFPSVKITLIWYYYNELLNTWYSRQISNVNCTSSVGTRIQHEPSINTFCYFDVLKGSSDIVSCTLEIWSTYAW